MLQLEYLILECGPHGKIPDARLLERIEARSVEVCV